MKGKGKEVAPAQYFSFSNNNNNNNNNKVITFFPLGFCDSKDPMFTMTSFSNAFTVPYSSTQNIFL